MTPANQRFDPCNCTVRVHDNVVVHQHLLTAERTAQIAFELDTFGRNGVHLGSKEPKRVSSGSFGLVQTSTSTVR